MSSIVMVAVTLPVQIPLRTITTAAPLPLLLPVQIPLRTITTHRIGYIVFGFNRSDSSKDDYYNIAPQAGLLSFLSSDSSKDDYYRIFQMCFM